ncbi:MAG: tRNA (guanosine(37)-N1)-methyltransferase TrmD [Pseudomonadota bacterium]
MRIDIITLFPEFVLQVGEYGVTGRAVECGLIDLHTHNPREFALDAHRTVDDRPYGGGPGMVMKVEPLRAAIGVARRQSPTAEVIYVSPQGRRLNQALVRELAQRESLILLAGRYEGIDERVIEHDVDDEISLGDYVLSGGELAAMVLIDAVSRLQAGALGHEESARQDSFSDDLLDCPHYTRPDTVDGHAIPAVLNGGDHAAIARWRRKQALGRTAQRRPDMIEGVELSAEDAVLLNQYMREIE